jgi:flagellar biosynthesis chaperone FliJ
MIRLGGLVSQKAFGKFEMGKVISNPFATAFVNEAEGEDHEVSMGQNQLDTIIKMGTELKTKMGETEKEIPAWIQDHISKAENYISQASSNYHEYKANESRIAEDSPCWKGYKQVGMKDKGGRQVPNCVPESVVKEISGRTPKIFVKTAAVEKKIKELMADRKKAVVPYNSETDPAKKEKLKQILIKLTNQIKGYEKNLVQLRDMEETYLQQLHADAELDTTGL